MWSLSRISRKVGIVAYKKIKCSRCSSSSYYYYWLSSKTNQQQHYSFMSTKAVASSSSSFDTTSWFMGASVAIAGSAIMLDQCMPDGKHDDIATATACQMGGVAMPNDNVNTTSSAATAAAIAANEFANNMAKGFTGGVSKLRRHQTIHKMQISAVKELLENKYNVLWDEPIGEGTFGQVFLATNKVTGEELAVKKISKEYTNDISFQREMDALLHLRVNHGHPHICGLRENYEEGDCYYLILDLVSGGEMFEHLCTNGAYSEADAARLIRQVASALAFLHGIGIVHGDLKPENLMLSSKHDSDAVMQVVDFGCAQTIIEDKDGHMVELHQGDGGIASTPAYCPPEVLEQKYRRKKGVAVKGDSTIEPSFDMWALGVIIYIMLTGVHPFDLAGNASDAEIEHQVMSGARPPLRNSPITAHLSKDAITVIEELMQRNAKKRLTAHELLQDPWVRGETASTNKMADSDKRLTAYRAFKTKLEAKVFCDMAALTISSNDDDVQNVTDEELVHQRTEILRNPGGKGRERKRESQGTTKDSVGKRTSLIEMAFHSLDPQHRGYVTTADLQKLSGDGGNANSKATNTSELDQLSLAGFSDLLAENMKDKYFPKGHLVYHEGEVGNNMYFINSGTVEVFTRDGCSKTIRHAGDFFGEGALLNPSKTRSASIRCLTPVHVLEISREYFEKYLASDNNIKLNLREKDKSRKRQRAKAILRLQHNMQERSYKFGDVLFREGDEGNQLFIVDEGKVGISAQNFEVFSVKGGEMCGEHALIFGKPYNTTATCISKAGCKIHTLRSREFYNLLDTHPSMTDGIREIAYRRDFQKALCRATKKSFPSTEKELRDAFDLLDYNKSGFLELRNIRTMMKKFDPTYSEHDIRQILHSLDLDETGSVSWEEFKRVFGYVDVANQQLQHGDGPGYR